MGNDPVNKIDPTGMYGRGSGWSDKEWKKFDKIQQKAAGDMEKRAGKLEKEASKMEANGQVASGHRLAASNLRAGASSLRSNGSDGKVANLKTNAEAVADGRSAGVAAWVPKDNKSVVNVVLENKSAWGSTGMSKWTIGHESLHSTGIELRDQRGSNGERAYKHASDNERDSFNELQGTFQSYINPDHLMDLVY